jgi:hypothetical protein
MRALGRRAVILVLAAVAAAMTPASAASDSSLDGNEIVRRSFAASERNEELARLYTFHQRTEERALDKEGAVKSTKSKTHDVTLLDGSEYRRLIARDGQPLSPKEERKQQRKLDRSIERMRKETPQERARRLRKVRKEQEEHRKFREEITRAYDFRVIGEESIRGVETYVIDAEPRPEYEPGLKDAKILKKLKGRLWIAKDDFSWVQAKAETTGNVSFGWFLVRLNEGAQIEFSSRFINDEVWLLDHFRLRFRARLGLVKGLSREIESSFGNYRKFTTDSRIVSTEPVQ